jgi:hypothetical protein
VRLATDKADPEVLVSDPQASTFESAGWLPFSDHFSDCVYAMFFDGLASELPPRPSDAHALSGQTSTFDAEVLFSLRRRLTEGPRTRNWPGVRNHRFASERETVVVHAGDVVD